MRGPSLPVHCPPLSCPPLSLSLPACLAAYPPLPSPPLHLRSRPARIQLGGLGERCELPQRGLGRSPRRNRIWCILVVKFDIWWQQFRRFPQIDVTIIFSTLQKQICHSRARTGSQYRLWAKKFVIEVIHVVSSCQGIFWAVK